MWGRASGQCHEETVRGPLAAALLLLLTERVGDGVGDAACQGPVLDDKVNVSVMVGVQVLELLVRNLLFGSRVCQHVAELLLKHLSEAAVADLVFDQVHLDMYL